MILNFLSAIWAATAPALGNHLWQSTLCLIIAGLLTLVLRKNSARTRYGIWLAASIKFLLPFSLLIAIGTHFARPRLAAASQPRLFYAMEHASQPFTPAAQAEESRGPAQDAGLRSTLVDLLPAIIVAAWFCGFVAVIFVWYARWRRIAATVRNAAPLSEGREVEALRSVERRAGIRKPIDLLVSPGSLEPGVFGISRPVLLWPEAISERLDDAQLKAILAHEVWHVRRRDNLAAAIHMVVEALFWFHPLVWGLTARLVEERERACDEAVLQVGSERQVYAESILKTCEFFLESPLACVSGVTGADLKKRIVRIMTLAGAGKLSFSKKVLLASIGVVAIAGPVTLGIIKAPQASAQAAAVREWERAAGGKMAFEVASVRLSKPGVPERGKEVLLPWDCPSPKGGLLTANLPLLSYILFAYKMADASQWPSLMEHLPKWAQSDLFAIQARAEGNPTTDQLRLMMQSLLEERFKLASHTETRLLPVYALVLDKPGTLGPQLQPHRDNVPCSDRPDNPAPVAPDTVPPLYCGTEMWRMEGRLHFRMVDESMEQIASLLGGSAGFLGGRDRLPTLDQTGLSGKFDMNIEFVKDSERESTDSAVVGPTFTGALKNQLGLKLVKQTGPAPVFVIDHVERPSEN